MLYCSKKVVKYRSCVAKAMNCASDDDSQLELSSKASGGDAHAYVSLISTETPPTTGSPPRELSPSEEVAGTLQNDSIEDEVDHQLQTAKWAKCLSLSNFCFFLGSVFYLYNSIWTVIDAYRYYADEQYDDDDESDDEEESFWSAYRLLACMGALFYLANALIDGRVAMAEIQGQDDESGRFGDSPKWEISAAVTFGVAALCDLLSEIIWNDENMWSGYFAGCAAVDIYLLNAILVLAGRRPTFESLPRSLMSAGDILFLIGSVIDVLISLIDNPKAPSSRAIEIAWSSFVSAALWFLDSLLYILADHLSDDDDYSSVDSDESSSEDELEITSAVAESETIDADSSIDLGLHHRIRLPEKAK